MSATMLYFLGPSCDKTKLWTKARIALPLAESSPVTCSKEQPWLRVRCKECTYLYEDTVTARGERVNLFDRGVNISETQ